MRTAAVPSYNPFFIRMMLGVEKQAGKQGVLTPLFEVSIYIYIYIFLDTCSAIVYFLDTRH